MKRTLLILAACSSKPATREAPRDAATAAVVRGPDARAVTAPDAAALAGAAIDRLAGFRAIATATPATPADLEQLSQQQPVKNCGADNALALQDGDRRIVISVKSGVEVIQDGRMEGLDFEDCEGSSDDIEGAWLGQVIPGGDNELVVVHQRGGHNAGEFDLEVYERDGASMLRILRVPIEEYEGASTQKAQATLAPDGTIHLQRGETAEVWAMGPAGTFVKR